MMMADNDPRWITGRMPNDDGTYLATLKTDKGTVFVETICVIDGNWETEKLKVLAWMLLPPVYIPPKECEQNAVEVVHCNDCKHFNWRIGYCNFHKTYLFDRCDFCSFGERKDGETDGNNP